MDTQLKTKTVSHLEHISSQSSAGQRSVPSSTQDWSIFKLNLRGVLYWLLWDLDCNGCGTPRGQQFRAHPLPSNPYTPSAQNSLLCCCCFIQFIYWLYNPISALPLLPAPPHGSPTPFPLEGKAPWVSTPSHSSPPSPTAHTSSCKACFLNWKSFADKPR